MFELINKLDSWFKENRVEFYRKLNKGLTDNEIKLWEERFGFEFPEVFKILYQWRNGQKTANRECFFNHFYFDPIEVVFENREEANEDLIEFNEEQDVVWGESWLKFMSTIDSKGFCLDVNGDFKEVGNIVYYNYDSDNEIMFSKLEVMFEMIVSQFEQGVYGYQKINDIISFAIIDPIKENEIFEYYSY